MKNLTYIFGLLAVFSLQTVWGQNIAFKASNFKDKKEGFKKALEQIKKGDEHRKAGNEAIYAITDPGESFKLAIQSYEKAQQFNPKSALLNFKLGNCYLYTNEKYKAIDYIKTASKLDPEVDDFLPFYLGMVYQLEMEWDKATKEYKKFEASSRSKQIESLGRMLSKRIKECKNGKIVAAEKKRVWVDNMKALNSSADDYSPCISMDGSSIILTSNRENGKASKTGYDYDHDIYYSELKNGSWQKPKNMGETINSSGDETSGMLSYNGTKMLLYKDNEGNFDILESELKGAKWSEPKPFPVINSDDNQTFASYSYNSKGVYFITDRKKGSANYGLDIYMSTKATGVTGKWGFPQSIGKTINTKFNEGSVYAHPSGDILYFSSEGHNSMGGYDIFMTKKVQGQWSEPINLGYPINTPYDDHFFAATASEKYAYIASNRGGGEGGMDVYKVTFWGEDKDHEIDTEDYLLASVANPITDPQIEKAVTVKRKSLTVFKGNTIDAISRKAVQAEIIITDNTTGKKIETITTNSATGKFLLSLNSGKNYGIAVKAKGYLFHSENFDIPESSEYNLVDKTIELKNIAVGSKIALRNVFFDVGKAILRAESNSELDRLVKLMNEVKALKVEISGHTDNTGSESLNKKLSQDRAKAVVNYLVGKGISASRLEARGYGSSKPVASNKSSEGRQQNRRTEFEIKAN